jgi:predicted nucleic acid-binding protein
LIVVSDATALIDLIDGDCIAVLNNLFDEVIIPQEVFCEVFEARHGRHKPRWIKIRSATSAAALKNFATMRLAVDRGEAAAIAVAFELGLPVIMDDKAGVIQCELYRVESFSLYSLLKERLPASRFKKIVDLVRERTGKMLCEPEF